MRQTNATPSRQTSGSWSALSRALRGCYFALGLACACGHETSSGTPEISATAGADGGVAFGGSSGDSGAPTTDALPPAAEAGSDAGDTACPHANVTAVSVAGDAQAYDFTVSVESSDVDCSQYADWWEVLSEDGTLLYRRILEHSHTDANGTSDPDAPGNTFTRSGGPVAIAPGTVVVVRAHFSTVGYAGQAMRGSSDAGFSAAPDIDSGFAAAVVEQEPLPGGCAF